jgi:hypothetical protein
MNGATSGDALYVFHLASSRTVTLSLCPTLASLPGWDSVLYLRGACDDPGTNLRFNDDGCSQLSRIVRTLGPGTYYLVVDGYGNSDPNEGAFVLGFGEGEGPPVCTVTPDSAPLAGVEPDDSPALANDLGEFVEADAVRTGLLDADADPLDYYRFHVPCGEFVDYEVSLDCYGDGASANMAFAVLDGTLSYLDGRGGLGPVLSAAFTASPGGVYHVAVFGGSGPYRLRVAPLARHPVVTSGLLPGAVVADESEPNDDVWDADELGGVAAGGHLAAQGLLDTGSGDAIDLYSFVPTGAGIGVSVVLDSYDDGSGANDFGVLVRDAGGGIVAAAPDGDPVEVLSFTPVPGNTYFAEVTGSSGSGCYRLLLTGH